MEVAAVLLAGRLIYVMFALVATVCSGLSLGSSAPDRLARVTATVADGCRNAPALLGAPMTNQLMDELGISKVPISYVFVIDVSRSMQDSGLYPQALGALKNFLGVINPGDRIGVIIFAAHAETALAVAPLTNSSDVLSVLPDQAEGTATDIGAGLSQALGELQHVPSGQPATVVLLTDGMHNPPAGSRYPTTTGKGWDALAAEAARLRKYRQIFAFAIPLSGISGVDLLCSVFPDAQKLEIGSSADSLTNYLQRAQALTRLELATRLLRNDQGKGVEVEWPSSEVDVNVPSGTTTVNIRLRNTAPHLPAVVNDIRLVTTGDLPVLAKGLPSHLDLAPEQTVEYAIHLDWPAPHDSGWRTGERRYDTKLSLVGSVSSPLADRLQSLPLHGSMPNLSASILGGPEMLSGFAPLSWNPWPLLVLIGLALAGLLVAARRWPSMTGQLEFHRMEDRDGHDVDILVVRMPLYGRFRTIAVDAVDPRSAHTAARIVVWAHRNLWTGVVRLRVGIRFTALRRGALREVAEWGRLLIMGLDARHMRARQQTLSATAILTEPITDERPAERDENY